MKVLEVGGGENPRYHPNLDIRDLPQVDIVADIRDGIPFCDGVLDLIYCNHLIEHLNFNEAERFIDECHRVLAKKGRLIVGFPDIKEIADYINYRPINLHSIDMIYGAQDYETNLHKSGFNTESLRSMVEKKGFRLLGETVAPDNICKLVSFIKDDPVIEISDDLFFDLMRFLEVSKRFMGDLINDIDKYDNEGSFRDRSNYYQSIPFLLRTELRSYNTNNLISKLSGLDHILQIGGNTTVALGLSTKVASLTLCHKGIAKDFAGRRLDGDNLKVIDVGCLGKLDNRFDKIVLLDPHMIDYKILLSKIDEFGEIIPYEYTDNHSHSV